MNISWEALQITRVDPDLITLCVAGLWPNLLGGPGESDEATELLTERADQDLGQRHVLHAAQWPGHQ